MKADCKKWISTSHNVVVTVTNNGVVFIIQNQFLKYDQIFYDMQSDMFVAVSLSNNSIRTSFSYSGIHDIYISPCAYCFQTPYHRVTYHTLWSRYQGTYICSKLLSVNLHIYRPSDPSLVPHLLCCIIPLLHQVRLERQPCLPPQDPIHGRRIQRPALSIRISLGFLQVSQSHVTHR